MSQSSGNDLYASMNARVASILFILEGWVWSLEAYIMSKDHKWLMSKWAGWSYYPAQDATCEIKHSRDTLQVSAGKSSH